MKKQLYISVLISVAFAGALSLLRTDSASAAACAPPADYGSVTQSVTVPTSGTYRVWSRIKAPDTTNNSYLLQVDGTTCYKVGDNTAIPANTWTWVNYQNGTTTSVISATLSAGSHSFVMYGNEPNVQLDRVVLTTDTACVPTGTGDNCANPPDTTPPTVAISSPANNAVISSTTTVTATASDDVGLAKVEFYVDGVLVGTDTSAAYTYSLNPASFSVGSHTLTAKAYDTAATPNVTTSTIVNFTIPDSTAPTAAITAPTAGATITGTVTYSANATDNVGVVKVEFYVDGALKGTDTTSPYSISLDTTSLTNASHSLTVKSYDAANNSTTSAAVSVTVNNPVTPPPDTTAPSVSVSSPTAGTTITGSATVAATATDNVGVSKVEFYADGVLKNTDTTAPYSYSLDTTTLTNGTHSLTAKAYDAANNSATSAAVSVSVSNAVILPEDINMDGHVDLLDFSLLSSKFGQSGAGVGRSDIDGNSTVDLLDFSRLANKFGTV